MQDSSAYVSLQLGYSIYKGLVQDQLAVSLGNADHIHSAAVPARALKLQVSSTRLHQILCSFNTQPCGSVPDAEHRHRS